MFSKATEKFSFTKSLLRPPDTPTGCADVRRPLYFDAFSQLYYLSPNLHHRQTTLHLGAPSKRLTYPEPWGRASISHLYKRLRLLRPFLVGNENEWRHKEANIGSCCKLMCVLSEWLKPQEEDNSIRVSDLDNALLYNSVVTSAR